MKREQRKFNNLYKRMIKKYGDNWWMERLLIGKLKLRRALYGKKKMEEFLRDA